MKRFLTLASLLVIVTVLIFSGCAQPAPAPAPAPKTTPTPAPAKHAEVSLTFWAGPFGGTPYVCQFALMDTLNKKHPWLRGTIIETKGSWDNHLQSGKDPAKRPVSVAHGDVYSFYESTTGVAPQMKDVKPFAKGERLIIGTNANSAQILVTQNASIKTDNDVKGTKMAGWTAGAGGWNDLEYLLKVMNIAWKDLKSYDGMAPDAKTAALKDGLIDIAHLSEPYVIGKPEFMSANLADLSSQPKPLYRIPCDKAAGDKVAAADQAVGKAPRIVEVIPAGHWAKAFVAGGALVVPMVYYVWKEVPEEIQYELARSIIEYNDTLTAHGGQAEIIVPNLLVGGVPTWLRDQMAPGAMKYYKEKGLIDKYWK